MAHKNFGKKGWLQPMPVAIIGTYNADGTPNAMNAAWVGEWDATQITISLSKHTSTANINANMEFTVALANKENMVAADYVGITPASKDPDKVATCGWTVEKAEFVNAPVFTNFPLTLECKVAELVGQTEVGGGCNLIADVVNARCEEAYLDENGNPDLDKIQILCFDTIGLKYRVMGEVVGNAFKDGAQLSK